MTELAPLPTRLQLFRAFTRTGVMAVGGGAGVTERLAHSPLVKAVRGGLVPVAIRLIPASGLIMTQAVAGEWVALAVVGAATMFVWRTEFSPMWALGAGGVAGVLLL